MALEQWRGATLHLRSVAATGRSYLASDQGWRPRGDTPRPRSGAARRSHLAPEARGGSWEEPPTPKARAGGREDQPEAAQAQEGLEA